MAWIQNVYRPDFRTYMLLLCMVYLAVMVLFHVDLQQMRQVQIPPQSIARTSHGHAATHHDHAGAINDSYSSTIQTLVTHKLHELYQPVKLRGADIKPSFHTPCGGSPDDDDNFIEVISGTLHVYSAYLDERPNDFDNRNNGSFIRIMAVMRGRAVTPKTSCLFDLANGTTVIEPIKYYEMCENHGRPYGGFILSCRTPHNMSVPLCSVRVTGVNNEGNSTLLKVKYLRPQPNRVAFGICVPPLFGRVNKKQLIEFIELSQILGAGRITFYDYGVSDEIVQVFRYYQSRGVLTVAKWRYPAKLERLSWYHGQLIAIQDCLYRSMSTVRFLTFNDIDEYVIPHQHRNWEDMTKAMFKPKHCGIQFQNAFFTPGANTNDLLTLASTQRTSHMSVLRTKCMVRSDQVYELGIHHVSKPILAYLKVAMMPSDVAFLHHYRPCMKDFGFNCNGHVLDNHTMKYGTLLRSRVNRAYDSV